MCGINGFNWPDQALVEKMNHATRYRGPDDRGRYVDNQISLGFCRLSIIDLSADGNQPMSNEDGSIWVVFNGEIYNYRTLRAELVAKGHLFRSQTDTEIIIHGYEEYGLEVFNRLRGMWGLCLYDRHKAQMILCRDRFGIKPLYYFMDAKRLVFSSMIAGILCHDIPKQPNDQAVMEFLAFNLEQHTEQTFFAGVNSLLPGHLLRYDLASRRGKVDRWYSPQQRFAVGAEELREIFDESVRLHLVSDVPVGVCLSGGIDSTAIACTMHNELLAPFCTYSLTVPGSLLDESRYIKEVGRLTQAQQYFTTIQPEEFLSDLGDFVSAMEEPVTGLSAYAQYKVFKLAHEQGAKVLLDGQGGDELFAGYHYYYGYRFYELFSQGNWLQLVSEMRAYHRKMGGWFAHGLFGFLLLPNLIRRTLWRRNLTPWLNHELLVELCGDGMDPRWQRMGVRQILNQTLFSTSIPHNLMWEDKSSMRWSIECRVPFVDVDMVEAALGLDTDLLLTNGETKRLFKAAIWDILPVMIRNRKDKIGFQADEDGLFRDERVAPFVDDIVHSASFQERPYWDGKVLLKEFEEHMNGRVNSGQLLWKCINLELWLGGMENVR